MKVANSWEKIPNESSVMLYGIGRTGGILLEDIVTARPDINVIGILDTYNEGIAHGLKIYNLSEINFYKPNYIILATRELNTSIEMREVLGEHKINSEIIWPYESGNSIVISSIDEEKINKINDELVFGSDIYMAVIKSLLTGSTDYITQCQIKNNYNDKLQYLEGPGISIDDIIIDGGTFDGHEALSFSLLAPKGFVYSFDPFGDNKISISSELKKRNNVEIIKAGLYSKTTTLSFHENKSPTGAAGSFVSEERLSDSEEINAVSIDDFVEKRKLSSINFIKMDIEGSEPKALIGAVKTIKRCKPKLAICVYHDPSHYYEIYDIVKDINNEYRVGFGHYSNGLSESVMYFY